MLVLKSFPYSKAQLKLVSSTENCCCKTYFIWCYCLF